MIQILGYTCDTKDGRCNKGEISIPFYQKISALKKVELKTVTCPDGSSECKKPFVNI